MKKVLIAIIDKDKRYCLPMQGNYIAFNECLRKIVGDSVVAIGRKMYDALPSKSPPFPNNVLYVVSEQMLPISPLAKTFVIPSWIALFETLADNGETLFIFVDKASYNDFFSSHKEKIDEVIVAQVNKKVKNTDLFEDPAIFEWLPQLIDEGEVAGRSCPGYTVHRYMPAGLHP